MHKQADTPKDAGGDESSENYSRVAPSGTDWGPASSGDPQVLDRMRTLKEAAQTMGLPYATVQRAAKAGLLPTYQLFNRRKYVTLRDIYRQMSSRT